jgi:hypothetical protein
VISDASALAQGIPPTVAAVSPLGLTVRGGACFCA